MVRDKWNVAARRVESPGVLCLRTRWQYSSTLLPLVHTLQQDMVLTASDDLSTQIKQHLHSNSMSATTASDTCIPGKRLPGLNKHDCVKSLVIMKHVQTSDDRAKWHAMLLSKWLRDLCA